ncbi:branched-chain amino acid transport system permease protein [Hoyosella altamirensis]|uniref:Branched-chain amino acid transport system permease protein n=1 Tax=Hoyosella altamirensis TaxID=616997 RepID=A0A839RPJ3_9ACTN|nr:branched-chain amino acid ABC transporter permease [Hoyosella altamirensis]MBB3038715.1 branched-chain amino acid transport system permease protein [Hoyosella altamirensis]
MTHSVTSRLTGRGAAVLLALMFSLVVPLLAAGSALAQNNDEEGPLGTIQGTLINAGEPLNGVTIEATDEDGDVAGEATSSERGQWSMRVSPGTYTVRLDEATLPVDVIVQQAERSATVRADRVASVIYSFGDPRTGLETTFTERFLRLTVEGLRFGLVIAITAVGLSLIFGTTGLTNFAHGELVTIGAVAAWVVNVKLGMHLIPATVIAIIVGIIVGVLNNAIVWRPLRNRGASLVAQLVVSIGLALALRAALLLFFSDRSQAFTTYQSQRQQDFGPISTTPVNLATMLISLAVLIAVALMFKFTRIGKAMRAVSDNRDLAAASGINVERVVMFVWALGGGLAALGGVLFGLSELNGTVQFEMGFKLLLLMFAGIILGGLGTAYGALLGCVIIGLLVQWSTLVINPDLKYTGGLLVLILVLVLRPQGILGSRARIG